MKPGRAAVRVLLLCGVALAVVGALADEQPAVAGPPHEGEVVRRLAEVVEQVEGLNLAAPPTVTYAGTPAVELLPGADLLSAYGYLWTVSACFEHPPARGICCHVHRFESAMEAFGPFSLLKEPLAQDAVAIPTMAYWVGGQLHVWRGEYYVQIVPVLPGAPDTEPPASAAASAAGAADARATIGLIAEAFLGVLPVPTRLPTLLSVVPLPGRFIGPVRFEHVAVAGLEHSVERVQVRLVETYESDCVLSICRAATVEDAEAVYAELLADLRRDAGPAAHLPLLADDAAIATGPGQSVSACMRQDNYVACVEGGTSRDFAEAVLMIVASHVRIVLVTGGLSDPQ